MGKASLVQAGRLIQLVADTGWSAEEVNRRIIERFGLLRDIAVALDDPRLTEENMRAMHPLFYNKPPSFVLAADLIPSGYAVVEDVAPTLKSAGDLEAVSSLNEGEPPIGGEEMRVRAKRRNANLGLADLKVALADQGEISMPEGVRYIVFAGTVLRNPDGDLCVAYLVRSGDGWCLSFGGVADDWNDNDRLARCK